MKRTLKRCGLALVAATLVAVAGMSLYGQSQTQNQATGPARSRAEETLEWWNQIGNKLIAMAKDFPEDKYDFKAQKDQRTFAQNLLHVAAIDYFLPKIFLKTSTTSKRRKTSAPLHKISCTWPPSITF